MDRSDSRSTSRGFFRGKRIIARLIVNQPRATALGNVIVSAVIGFVIGLILGGFVSFLTIRLPSRTLMFVANAFLAMTVKLVWQWMWEWLLSSFVLGVAQTIVQTNSGTMLNRLNSAPTDQRSSLLLVVTVTTAFATLLTLDGEIGSPPPGDALVILLLTALVGAITAVMESLSMPSNIYALVRNRQTFQNTGNSSGASSSASNTTSNC